MVKDCPAFHEKWEEIKPFIDGKTIIAHNCNFDIPILLNLVEKRSLSLISHPRYFCTLEYSRKLLKKKYGIGCRLEDLCCFYKLPYGKHNGAKDTVSTLFVLNQLFYENYIDKDRGMRLLKGKKWAGSVPLTTASVHL